MGRVAIILASVLMLACEDPIDIEIPNVIERVVVEGIISNEPSSSQVLLSLTNRFDDTSSNPTISDAQVSVIDDSDNIVVYQESEPGKYASPTGWQPTLGRSYKCLITLPGGKRIVSTWEKLVPIPKIDSLYAERKLPILILAGIEQFEYYLNATITDDARENNFFRWQLKRNQQKLENPEDLVLFSDRFVNGEIFNYRLSRIIFVPGDSVTIKQSSLSTNAYNYYNLLFQQATKLGQASGTAPALLKGNLINPDDNSELVLGYFRASAYTQKAFLFN
jgi:hypothetical protein